jgi:hypothetical protein
MAKRNGKRVLKYAIDQAVDFTPARAAGEFGKELMAHAIKTDPTLVGLIAQLARARVKQELRALMGHR